jgi:hypothetical protein
VPAEVKSGWEKHRLALPQDAPAERDHQGQPAWHHGTNHDLLGKKQQPTATAPALKLAESTVVALADERAPSGEGITVGELEPPSGALSLWPTSTAQPAKKVPRDHPMAYLYELNRAWR